VSLLIRPKCRVNSYCLKYEKYFHSCVEKFLNTKEESTKLLCGLNKFRSAATPAAAVGRGRGGAGGTVAIIIITIIIINAY